MEEFPEIAKELMGGESVKGDKGSGKIFPPSLTLT
jgi:hypothetical protein